MKTSSHTIFSAICSSRKRQKWVWLIRNRVLRVQLMVVRFKSSENQTGFDRRKPENRFGKLIWHMIDRSRWRNRSIEVGSSFCDRLTWAWSISICSVYFCCSGYIYQDRPVQIERLLMGSNDPSEKKKLRTLGFFRDF